MRRPHISHFRLDRTEGHHHRNAAKCELYSRTLCNYYALWVEWDEVASSRCYGTLFLGDTFCCHTLWVGWDRVASSRCCGTSLFPS